MAASLGCTITAGKCIVFVGTRHGCPAPHGSPLPLPQLSFTPALFFSRLIKGIPYFFLNKAASDAILYFNHHRGLSLDEFKTNPTISRNLNVLPTAKARAAVVACPQLVVAGCGGLSTLIHWHSLCTFLTN